jgi:hypothetical protein
VQKSAAAGFSRRSVRKRLRAPALMEFTAPRAQAMQASMIGAKMQRKTSPFRRRVAAGARKPVVIQV